MAMARNKTAVLLEAACRVGAILGGGDERDAESLGTFGAHLGIAFQIRDDLLPYLPGPAGTKGKPAESDVRNQRPILPGLLAHRNADRAGRAAIRHALLNESDPRVPLEQMSFLSERFGAVQAACLMADEHLDQALRAIAEVGAGPHCEALSLIAETLVGRSP